MRSIRLYEPALCCDTGVCGPDVDQALIDFTADLNHLKGLGVDIERHNLANDPAAFAENDTVRAYLEVAGSDGLPLTLVDGVTAMTGGHPTRSQLLSLAGLPESQTVPAGATDLGLSEKSDGCCGSGGCC